MLKVGKLYYHAVIFSQHSKFFPRIARGHGSQRRGGCNVPQCKTHIPKVDHPIFGEVRGREANLLLHVDGER